MKKAAFPIRDHELEELIAQLRSGEITVICYPMSERMKRQELRDKTIYEITKRHPNE